MTDSTEKAVSTIDKWRPIVLALLVGGGAGGFGNQALKPASAELKAGSEELGKQVTKLDKAVDLLNQRLDFLDKRLERGCK